MADNDINVEGLPMFGLVSVGVTSLQPLSFIYCCKIVLMFYNGLHIAEGGDYKARNLNLKQMYNRSTTVHFQH